MRFVGHGHPAVRATHAKTWELTPDDVVTERGTCILSVGTRVLDPGRLAGPVRLTVSCAGLSWSVDAVADPAWEPGGPAVVRRSAVRAPGTFATEASGTAADLPRELVERLADPAAEVLVDVDPLPSGPTVVLVALPAGPDPVLAAEFAAADLVVAEDATAARRLGERVTRGPVAVSGRVVVAAVDDLPGRTLPTRPPGIRVETHGLPPALAAAAALPAGGPVVLVPGGGDPVDGLRRGGAGARVVVRTTTDRVATVRADASSVLGEHLAAVAFADRPPLLLADGAQLPGRDPVWLGLSPRTAAADPSTVAMARGLLADGVPTKTVARALATLTGEPQRCAYDTVLGLRDLS